MDFSQLIKDEISLTAPIITLYGKNGLGKSSIASEFPKPIFIDLEGGLINVKRKHPHIKAWSKDAFPNMQRLYDAIDYLKNNEHGFETLVIDSLDGIDRIAQATLCKENGAKDMTAPCFGFGKGDTWVKEIFDTLMDKLKELRDATNIFIVLIAHYQQGNDVDPIIGDYSKGTLAINKKAAKVVTSISDCVFFLAQSASKETDGGKEIKFGTNGKMLNSTENRILYCSSNARYEAKNRFDMPPKFILQEGKTFDELMAYFTFQHPSQQLSTAA